MEDARHLALRVNAADRMASGLRAITSAVDLVAPGMGSLFGELIGHVIPNQREERVLAYVTKLGRLIHEARFVQAAQTERIEAVEAELEARRFGPERAGLFEDGARASARAASTERVERIATLVAEGMNGEESDAAYAREVLGLADTLSDLDIAFLMRFDNPRGRETQPRSGPEAYGERPISRGDYDKLSTDDKQELDRQRAFVPFRRERLAGLGLLRKELTPGRTIQQGGRTRSTPAEATFLISELGRILLTRMGVARTATKVGSLSAEGP